MIDYETIFFMVENLAVVIVDEAFRESSGTSYLKVSLVMNDILGEISFPREASPQDIYLNLHETGCELKYDEDIDLPEEDKQEVGNVFIEASYNVPGL